MIGPQGQIAEDINYTLSQSSHQPQQPNVPHFDIKNEFDQIHSHTKDQNIQKITAEDLLPNAKKENGQDILQFRAEQGQPSEEIQISSSRLKLQYSVKTSEIPKIISVSQQILQSVDKFLQSTNKQIQETLKKAMDAIQQIKDSQKEKEQKEKEVAQVYGKFISDVQVIEKLSKIEVQRQIQKNNKLKRKLQLIIYDLQKLDIQDKTFFNKMNSRHQLINSQMVTQFSTGSKDVLHDTIAIVGGAINNLKNKLQSNPKLQSVFEGQRPGIYDSEQEKDSPPPLPNKKEIQSNELIKLFKAVFERLKNYKTISEETAIQIKTRLYQIESLEQNDSDEGDNHE